jgi:hypothetical protein
MLLRRVTLHIRDQNWTAVFIDFVIVIVGVFVGLQVQDWNEFRKDRIEERQLLGRLLEETELLIDANALLRPLTFFWVAHYPVERLR